MHTLFSGSWATISFSIPLWGDFLLAAAFIWTGVWKGFALWRAVKKNSIPWFIVLLIVNTLGILEILYLYVFSKDKPAA